LPFSLLLAGFSAFAGRLMAKYGPRILLTIGPGMVAVGFVLLALPGVTGGVQDFWTTYFPGIVAMGIGMGLTVAPLTTSVMGSVASRHAGVASGINNAVTRSSQVLATAVLGAIALSGFSGALLNRVTPLQLPVQAMQPLQQNAADFGNTAVPPSLDSATQVQVKQDIRLAFVDAFREVAFIAAGMAILSAIVSFILVSPKLKIEEET